MYAALQLNGSVKEPNKFHNYDTEKITRKASDAAEYIELFGLAPEIVVHDAFYERPPTYASSCMTISSERTKQLYIIAGFLPQHWLYK